MKLAKIGLILLLLVTIGSPTQGVAAAKAKEPVTKAAALTGPQKVVWDYYAAYLAWLQYDFKKGQKMAKPLKPVANRSLDPSLVTRHYIDSYKKLMEENQKTTPPGEVGMLDYDPIICAQDYPDNMAQASVVLIKNIGTEASVKVNLSGQKSDQLPIVKLKKVKECWRIDDIFCGKDNFDSLYQAMKKAEKQPKK